MIELVPGLRQLVGQQPDLGRPVRQALGEAVVLCPQGRDRYSAVLPLVALVRERRLHLGHFGKERVPLGAQLAAAGAFHLQLLTVFLTGLVVRGAQLLNLRLRAGLQTLIHTLDGFQQVGGQAGAGGGRLALVLRFPLLEHGRDGALAAGVAKRGADGVHGGVGAGGRQLGGGLDHLGEKNACARHGGPFAKLSNVFHNT